MIDDFLSLTLDISGRVFWAEWFMGVWQDYIRQVELNKNKTNPSKDGRRC